MKWLFVRVLSVLMVLSLTFGLAACGEPPVEDTGANGTTITTTTTTVSAENPTVTEGDATTTTTAAEPTESGTITETAPTEAPTTASTVAPTEKPTEKPAESTGATMPVTTTRPTVTTTRSSTKATTTTTRPTTTTTTQPVPQKPIRILAVGNSFSVDAMQKHLFSVLESLGYDDIILGNLYVAGCSIDTHWSNATSGKKAYYYYETRPTDGVWKTAYNVPITKAFEKVEWDVITVQQASPDSGRSTTFGNLANLVGWLKAQCPDAKILYHMTWAYQKDSTHWAFPAYYGSDQERMYNDIVTATRDVAAKTAGVDGVIPVGTAIQNLRTSTLGDTVTSDGHHLLDTYGDYTASVTWATYITGEDATHVTYRPAEIADHFDEIAASANHAVETPYAVTPC